MSRIEGASKPRPGNSSTAAARTSRPRLSSRRGRPTGRRVFCFMLAANPPRLALSGRVVEIFYRTIVRLIFRRLAVAMVERLAGYPTTAKQRDFEWDFTQGVQAYETWDGIEGGRSGPGAWVFEVTAEDIVSFNRSCLETDPMLVDPEYAAAHGGLRQHPLFLVQVVFYCIDTGIGSWLRSPGARNPRESIELFEAFSIGERITATITHRDKWIRRDKNYVEDQVDLHNQDGVLKATWFTRLILPPDRAALVRYASM